MAPKPAPISTASKTVPPQDYALSKVDFSDPTVGASTTPANPPVPARSDLTADLKKPSLVFVRSTETKPTMKPNVPEEAEEQRELASEGLPRNLGLVIQPPCRLIKAKSY